MAMRVFRTRSFQHGARPLVLAALVGAALLTGSLLWVASRDTMQPSEASATCDERLGHVGWVVEKLTDCCPVCCPWPTFGLRWPSENLHATGSIQGLRQMGREGLEPSTLGLRVPCSTN
jgi:hypothetical protein